jgi:hypothetical protein
MSHPLLALVSLVLCLRAPSAMPVFSLGCRNGRRAFQTPPHSLLPILLSTAGHSGLAALAAHPDIMLTTFDEGKFESARRASALLHRWFPNRNVIVTGDSAVSLPSYVRRVLAKERAAVGLAPIPVDAAEEKEEFQGEV